MSDILEIARQIGTGNCLSVTFTLEELAAYKAEIVAADRAQRQAEPVAWIDSHALAWLRTASGAQAYVMSALHKSAQDGDEPIYTAAPPPAQVPLTVDLPERVVDVVAQSMGLSGPFSRDFYDFAQALKMEVIARIPSHPAAPAKDAEMAALKAELDTALLGVVRLSAEKHALRQEAHDICMSRSLSLSRDGKHAEANEASKCASAVKFAKLDAAIAQAVRA
jgi:hypothetical protein